MLIFKLNIEKRCEYCIAIEAERDFCGIMVPREGADLQGEQLRRDHSIPRDQTRPKTRGQRRENCQKHRFASMALAALT